MERNSTFSGLFDDDESSEGENIPDSSSDAVPTSEIDEMFPIGETDDPDSSEAKPVSSDDEAKVDDEADDDTKYLVSLSDRGLHIEDPEIFKKLDKLSLSPSTVAAMEQCPAKWAFEKYAKKEIVGEDDDTPARRGNVFHDIMENFFKLKPEDRTPAELTAITKTVITQKYPEFATNGEVLRWVKDAIEGYYKMGGKPKKVNVANVPKHKRNPDDPDEVIPGLEIFVKGKLGNATRETLGFIDQVLEDAKSDDDAVIVSDWKSGAKFKEFKKTTKSDDGFNEVRQQIIYTMLMEQKGVNVSSARLIYPVARKVVNVDIDDNEIRLRIIDSIEKADKKLNESIEANTFEYGPSFLCSWCPLVNICRAAEKKPFKKAVDARKIQPTPEELMTGVKIQ